MLRQVFNAPPDSPNAYTFFIVTMLRQLFNAPPESLSMNGYIFFIVTMLRQLFNAPPESLNGYTFFIVTMLRQLFNAPPESLKDERNQIDPSVPATRICGVSTVGSSEAIHLAALNMMWMWRR